MKRRVLFLLLTLLVASGLTGSVRGQTQPGALPLEEYWQQVQATRDQVAALGDLSPAEQQAALLQEAGRFSEIRAVVLPSNVAVPLDHSHLIAALQADPPKVDRVVALLDEALAARAGWPEPIWGNTALAQLRAILSRPEFRWAEPRPSPVVQWLNDLLMRIDRFLAGIFPQRGDGDSALLDLLFSLAAAAALAFVFWYVARQMLAGLAPEARLEEGDDEDALLSSGQAFDRAQNLSSTGDFRSAVRYLYLSCLLALDEQGVLRYDRTRTNREVLHSLSGSPSLAATLGDIVEVFDRVWYGQHALEPGAFARYADQVHQLRSQP